MKKGCPLSPDIFSSPAALILIPQHARNNSSVHNLELDTCQLASHAHVWWWCSQLMFNGWFLPLFPSEITGFYHFTSFDSHITGFETSTVLSDVIEADWNVTKLLEKGRMDSQRSIVSFGKWALKTPEYKSDFLLLCWPSVKVCSSSSTPNPSHPTMQTERPGPYWLNQTTWSLMTEWIKNSTLHLLCWQPTRGSKCSQNKALWKLSAKYLFWRAFIAAFQVQVEG